MMSFGVWKDDQAPEWAERLCPIFSTAHPTPVNIAKGIERFLQLNPRFREKSNIRDPKTSSVAVSEVVARVVFRILTEYAIEPKPRRKYQLPTATAQNACYFNKLELD